PTVIRAGNIFVSGVPRSGSCVPLRAQCWWCGRRNMNFVRRRQQPKPRKTSMNAGTRITPMATRVALHPFLAGMNSSHLALLTDCAMVVHFKPAELVFREGELANRFYLIESGAVILESSGGSGDRVAVDKVCAGNLLGWSWMFPPYVW